MNAGKIKWFNEQKGFGFITQDDGTDVFIHKSDVPQGTMLREGDRVEFELGKATKGMKAVNVKRIVK